MTHTIMGAVVVGFNLVLLAVGAYIESWPEIW